MRWKCEHDIEFVKRKVEEIDPTIEILSDTYISTQGELKCRCKIDGHEWTSTWNMLSKGKGCRECWIRSISGENCKFWEGGTTLLYKYLRLYTRRWKKDSMISCGYRCAVSGGHFDDIHHIYGFDLICSEVLERLELPLHQNIGEYSQDELELLGKTCEQIHYKHGLGVCLSKDIHEQFHRIYGMGSNTPEQWDEFLMILKDDDIKILEERCAS